MKYKVYFAGISAFALFLFLAPGAQAATNAPFRDGTVVCSNSNYDAGTCYLITDYKKAPFASLAVMKQQGYDITKAVSGDVSLVASDLPITDGAAAHRYGTLVNLDGTIYFSGKNSLMGFPDLATLQSWGFNVDDAVIGNSADRARGMLLLVDHKAENEPRPFEPIIPAPLQLSNENKFVVPFAGKVLPMTEGWLYSKAEREVHGAVQHGGIDFAYNRGTPVYAAADGYAVSSTHLSTLDRTYQDKKVGFGLGEFIQIWHPTQGVYTSYSHLQRVHEDIPYFKPTCKDGACDPEIVYNDTDYIQKKGKFVKQGQLIGWMGDSGLSWGYKEQPRVERNHKEDESWDEVHVHFEMYTRDTVNFYKARRYDPFGIYGRLNLYSEQSYYGPNAVWKLDAEGKPVLAK